MGEGVKNQMPENFDPTISICRVPILFFDENISKFVKKNKKNKKKTVAFEIRPF